MCNFAKLVLLLASVTFPLALWGCARKTVGADAGSRTVSARPESRAPARTPVLPPEAPLGRTPRVLFAGAILQGGKVVHRGWLHVGLDGKGLARFPQHWGVPYDARVDVSPAGDLVVWVTVDGRLGLSGATGARQLAQDAEASVTPAFTHRPPELLYARRRGPLMRWRQGTSSVVTTGPVRGLAPGPERRSYVFVRAGNELVRGDLARRETKTLHRSAGTRVRLLHPLLLADGRVLVRERDGSRARLLRTVPGRGPAREVPVPPGKLRAATPGPGHSLLLGMARRQGRRLFGDLYLQGPAPKTRRRLGSWARTLPFARLSCDGNAAVLVDSSKPMARLVAVPLAPRGRTRALTPASLRVFDARSWALWCPGPRPRPAAK